MGNTNSSHRGSSRRSSHSNTTRKGAKATKSAAASAHVCKKMDMSIQPNAFKKLSPAAQVAWHICYSKRLTRRATHIKRAREKQWLKAQAKDQLKWAEEIRRKHKIPAVEVK
jgi:hypothetical protein